MSTETQSPKYEIERVSFYGEHIEGVRCENGEVRIGIKLICENLGVAFSGQIRNLTTTHAHWSGVNMMLIPDERGRPQEHATIPLDSVPMWLANIKLNKVAEEIRPKLSRYQVEAKIVLARHFLGGSLHAAPGLAALSSQVAALHLLILQKFADNDGAVGRSAKHRKKLPPGYYRVVPWAKSRGILLSDGESTTESKRCGDYSADMALPVIECQLPNENIVKKAYHEQVLLKWIEGYCNRHHLQVTDYLPFRP